jgi:leucyl/phenylalanyl-tRNA---protein transferase
MAVSEANLEEPVLSMPVSFLNQRLSFPDPGRADRNGLVAIGGDLSVERLLLAYRSGIFPWTADPITWWSPHPRAILEFGGFRASASLRKLVRKQRFTVTFNQAFTRVMEECAAPGPDRQDTWIATEFIEAYTELHRQGWAQSLECWLDGILVGGIYGVSIGGFFAGESMFYRISNASKVALFHLVKHLDQRGYELFDLQELTGITRQLGGVNISRQEYLRRLQRALEKPCSFL